MRRISPLRARTCLIWSIFSANVVLIVFIMTLNVSMSLQFTGIWSRYMWETSKHEQGHDLDSRLPNGLLSFGGHGSATTTTAAITSTSTSSSSRSPPTLALDNIVYFNSFANPQRRAFMESWLSSNNTIHDGTSFNPSRVWRFESVAYKRTANPKQKELVGNSVTRSFLRLRQMKHLMMGTTLVLPDDSIRITDMAKLQDALAGLVLSSDNRSTRGMIIRLDCNTTTNNNKNNDNMATASVDHNSTRSHSHPIQYGSLTSVEHLQGPIHSNAWIFLPDLQSSKRANALGTMLSKLKYNHDMDMVLGGASKLAQKYRVQCLNLHVTESATYLEKVWQPVEEVWFLADNVQRRISEASLLSHYHQPSPQPQQQQLQPPRQDRIDKIIYHSMPKNTLRRRMMESWLQHQPIPYTLVEAGPGVPHGCDPQIKTQQRCIGVSGLLFTLLNIIEHQNMTGTTLVLEDDIMPVDGDLRRLEYAIHLVPDDWDILRFDCWGLDEFELDWINPYVANTTQYQHSKACRNHPRRRCEPRMYSGTYAMLWRQSSIQKLHKMWSERPYNDADRIAGRTNIHSYCVNIGIFEHLMIQGEGSDISWFELQ